MQSTQNPPQNTKERTILIKLFDFSVNYTNNVLNIVHSNDLYMEKNFLTK